jgi:hypothetical protein
MAVIETLLMQKQQLIERLNNNPGRNERAEIEGILAQINAALNLLEEAGPSTLIGTSPVLASEALSARQPATEIR